MPTTRIERQGEALIVATHFTLRERCKTVPGCRWDPDRRVWQFPASPATAASLAQSFMGTPVAWSPEVLALLAAAEGRRQAQVMKTADDTRLPPIPIAKTPPWAHQLKGYHWLMNLWSNGGGAAAIFWEMGCGKSRTACDAVVNKGFQRTLIVCPKSVVSVWPQQFALHAGAPIRVLPLDEGSVDQRAAQAAQALRLAAARREQLAVVANYDTVWRGALATLVHQTAWDCLVLDEMHRTKSPKGRASLFLRLVASKIPYRLGLTGTPLPHSPLDGFAQYAILDPGIFGESFVRHRAYFAKLGGYGNHEIIGYQHLDELHEKLYSIAYRVTADEVLDLPPEQDLTLPVRLSPQERKVYQQLEQAFQADVAGGRVTPKNGMVRLLRLHQATSGHTRDDNGMMHVLGDSKLATLADWLEDLPPEEPVVCFARFRHDLDTLRQVIHAMGRTYAELSGHANELECWQQGQASVLGVQMQAGGLGVSMVRAKYAVFISMSSLGDYLQARARVHRPGQAHRVLYVHLVAQGTVDEKIYRALAARQSVIESVLQSYA
jgi:SNF2 family DNA or RNA helicase